MCWGGGGTACVSFGTLKYRKNRRDDNAMLVYKYGLVSALPFYQRDCNINNNSLRDQFPLGSLLTLTAVVSH